MRDQLHLMQPGMDFLLCKSNEGRTGDGFEAMGARLALEVAEYLQVGGHQHLLSAAAARRAQHLQALQQLWRPSTQQCQSNGWEWQTISK